MYSCQMKFNKEPPFFIVSHLSHLAPDRDGSDGPLGKTIRNPYNTPSW